MRIVKRIASIVLLGLGTLFVLAAFVPPDPSDSPSEQHATFWGCLLLGVPMGVSGGWLTWALHAEKQRQRRDRLQTLFFESVRQHQGQLTAMQFAMATNLSGDLAKRYLDARAKEFSANFDVDQQGTIVYQFPVQVFNESQDAS